MWNDCIEHLGKKDPQGYGYMAYRGRSCRAHRVAYCMDRGLELEDIQGFVIRHKCDWPSCVNPDHLELGTQDDNMKDMVARGRPRGGAAQTGPRSRISQEKADEIRRRYVKGCRKNGTPSLAKEFGVDRTTISKVINGHTWNN